MNDILDLDGAAALLLCSSERLRQRAAAGEVPGRKVGRRWVFARAALIAWLSAPVPETTPCSTAAKTRNTGGAVSRSVESPP